MRKLNKKKLLLGIAGVLVILVMAFYIFINFVYLPGVHVWWRFCSVNIEKNCYWYDKEVEEFTGEYSAIQIKMTGFRWPEWVPFINSNHINDFNGEVEIDGYPVWRAGNGDFDSNFIYWYNKDGLWNSLTCWEHHAEPGEIMLRYGDVCNLYFPKNSPIPEHIMVQVSQENKEDSSEFASWEMVGEGYVADSLEEAKAMQEYGFGKKP